VLRIGDDHAASFQLFRLHIVGGKLQLLDPQAAGPQPMRCSRTGQKSAQNCSKLTDDCRRPGRSQGDVAPPGEMRDVEAGAYPSL
jgi:hypothetical protein